MYISAWGLNVHSRVAPNVVSNYRRNNRAMLPLRSMALSERDWSRFLRAGGDLFPNLIHRHLGDPGFRDELFDRLIRAALDQLVRVFLAQSQGQGQICMGGLVDVHEVRLLPSLLIGGRIRRRRKRWRDRTRSRRGSLRGSHRVGGRRTGLWLRRGGLDQRRLFTFL